MRNSTSSSTPKSTKAVQADQQSSSNNAAEKTSAKKLKQARLPFKIIAPGTSPVGSKPATTVEAAKDSIKDANDFKNGQRRESTTTATTDARKRKLSYDDSDGGNDVKEVDANDNVSKENIEVLAAASKKKKIADSHSSEGTPDDIVVLDDDSDEGVPVTTNTVAATKDTVMKTPKDLAKEKRKGAGTPHSSSSAQNNEKSGSASKLQIKLPISAGKKSKRRKSKLHHLTAANNSIDEGSINRSCAESSDDIEEVAGELNPQKRKKLDIDVEIQDKKQIIVKNNEVKPIALDSEPEIEKDKNKDKQTNVGETLKSKSIKTSALEREVEQNNDKLKNLKGKESPTSTLNKAEKSKRKSIEKSPKEVEVDITKSSESSDEDEDKEDLNESIQSDNDNEADDETDIIAAKSVNISSDLNEDSKTKRKSSLVESLKNPDNGNGSTKKSLTPKQSKLTSQRRNKAREEKERNLQEEKLKKQQEKEEKEQAKKRERDEKEDQRRKEREEKEEQKRKEREEKERKRLAEVEAKNEEKRKKNEAKEEELRKKEEERKRKEQEKEEERKRKEQEKEEVELKKKKAAQAFTKFFVAKTPTQAQLNTEEDSNTEDGTKLLAFRPFQVKGDMKLAPLCRKIFTKDAKYRLDTILGCRHKKILQEHDNAEAEEEEENIVRRKPLPKSQLYISELRSGKISPGNWRRPSTESKDDVIFVEDDSDRVGQAIVEDSPSYVREQMRVKFFKFHDNRRPPYYGTWRKKSSVIKPTKPFKQDKKFFDYEVDSDDEWEEEEPGESLEDGSDDDKEKESEDEDYEVDNEWFVPHGHLSDEELQNEDEFGTGDDNTREAQKAKLQILQQEFAQEMKKKTEKIKPRLIGCIWMDENGNQPKECTKIIWDTLKKKAMLYTEPPLVEEPEVERSTEPSSPSASNSNAEKATTVKPIGLSDNMVKDLTRLIHGNNHSKNFLINEYIAYIEKTEESIKNGDLRKPLKSVVRDKIDEMAEWQVVNATASRVQEMEQVNDEVTDSTKKKKKGKRRLCWVVKQEMLDKMDLSLLELQNSWKYTLPPKFVNGDKDAKPDETSTTSECNSAATTQLILEDPKTKSSATSQITKFTKILTAEEKVKNLQTSPPTPSSPSTNNKSVVEIKTKTPTSQTTKEKKRVPLIMSVARGQQISTPAKNKLISQFLQKGQKDNTTKESSSPTTRTSRVNTTTTSPTIEIEDDDVMILD